MSVDFKILQQHGLVYVRYQGIACAAETQTCFQAYMQHPDFQPGLKQFVDLSDLTGFEPDYFSIMQLQMMKAEAFLKGIGQTLMVYYAPNDIALEVAAIAARSWDDVDRVVAIVHQDEAEALKLLGLKAASLADLLARPAEPTATDL